MVGPIYFGGIRVSGCTDTSILSSNKEELQKKIAEDWKQEVRTVLKFIADTKLDMPLMKEFLTSSESEVLIQEYQEKIA